MHAFDSVRPEIGRCRSGPKDLYATLRNTSSRCSLNDMVWVPHSVPLGWLNAADSCATYDTQSMNLAESQPQRRSPPSLAVNASCRWVAVFRNHLPDAFDL